MIRSVSIYTVIQKLRDTETGEILGLAPNFDNNIALIARGYPQDVERRNDKLIELFIDFLNQNHKAVSYYNEMRIPEITENMIEECIDKTGFPVDREYMFPI